MRLVVDLTRCQGYAQCAFLGPDVFRMQGNEALWYDPEPGEFERDQVLAAAAACPVQALRVDGTHLLDGSHPARPTHGDRVAESFRRTGRIVIVGASLAGLEAGATLRREGFTGSLTLIGDEPYESYDRPPLSKQVLDGWVPAQRTALPRAGDVDAQWRLGVAATGLELTRKQVHLADGDQVGFDRLLIATGVRARPWPNPAEAALDGVFVLRGRDDAAALQQRLASGPRNVRARRGDWEKGGSREELRPHQRAAPARDREQARAHRRGRHWRLGSCRVPGQRRAHARRERDCL